jgi:hypothetical protein
MEHYQGDAYQDQLLLRWWGTMYQANEIVPILGERHLRLAQFFAAFQAPTQLFYAADEMDITIACWFDPSPLQAAFFSVWVCPAWRGSRRGLGVVLDALNAGFTEFRLPAIILVTNDEKIQRLHAHLGATHCGTIPGIYAGQDARISYITADVFPDICARFHRTAVVAA